MCEGLIMSHVILSCQMNLQHKIKEGMVFICILQKMIIIFLIEMIQFTPELWQHKSIKHTPDI